MRAVHDDLVGAIAQVRTPVRAHLGIVGMQICLAKPGQPILVPRPLAQRDQHADRPSRSMGHLPKGL